MEDFNKMFFGTLGVAKNVVEGDFSNALKDARELYYEHPAGVGIRATEPPTEPVHLDLQVSQPTEPIPIQYHPPMNPIQHVWDYHLPVIPVYDDGKKYIVGLQQPVQPPIGINPTFNKSGF